MKIRLNFPVLGFALLMALASPIMPNRPGRVS